MLFHELLDDHFTMWFVITEHAFSPLLQYFLMGNERINPGGNFWTHLFLA